MTFDTADFFSQCAKSTKSKKSRTPNAKKTEYIGSGLGLKQNKKLDDELHKLTNKGSTRHMIAQIVGDRDFG